MLDMEKTVPWNEHKMWLKLGHIFGNHCRQCKEIKVSNVFSTTKKAKRKVIGESFGHYNLYRESFIWKQRSQERRIVKMSQYYSLMAWKEVLTQREVQQKLVRKWQKAQ